MTAVEPPHQPQRSLLSDVGSQLYAEIAARPFPADHPDVVGSGPRSDAFAALLDLGMVELNQAAGHWQAVDPTGARSRVLTPLTRMEAELLSESAAWAALFDSFHATWRGSPSGESHAFIRLVGLDQIDAYIRGIVLGAREELLTAQPKTGHTIGGLARAVSRDAGAVAHGVSMRTLYQHAARRNRATRRYVQEMTSRGAEVRTLDEFFQRLIVVDREIAMIPAANASQHAIAILEPSVVAFLVDVFERHWERALRFDLTSDEAAAGTASILDAETRAMTIRLLLGGHSDAAAAKRLGVSARTYASYVSDLKSEYAVETRLQLGHALGLAQQDETAASRG